MVGDSIFEWQTLLKSKTVVLLDEADVFLEERSLADMQRNALVSGKLLVCSAA